MSDTDYPEHVGFEDATHVIAEHLGRRLARTYDAGAVDQHIHSTARGADLLGGGRDASLVGDIDPHEPRTELRCRLLTAFRITRRDPNGIAVADKAPGGFTPEALVCSCDECRSRHSSMV